MPIDYKAINNVVEINVSLPDFKDSLLIKFEMSYERKEGNYQTFTFPTYSIHIEPILQELKQRKLITKDQYTSLYEKLKSLEDGIRQCGFTSRVT